MTIRRIIRRIMLCCALAVGAWAAEDSEPRDHPPTDTTEEIDSDAPPRIETTEETKGDVPETATSESPDTFIPSENISENIAVKFPVDI